MSEKTKIQWTDHTFNPWRGCTKISEGCAHCYAETLSKRNPATLGVWGKHGHRAIAAESYWRDPVKWNRLAAGRAQYWVIDGKTEQLSRNPLVFCASLADVFEGDEEMPAASVQPVRAAQRRLFRLIHDTPNLDWLLLTKRPENILPHLAGALMELAKGDNAPVSNWLAAWLEEEPPNNVWLGTSVENQAAAEERIPNLLLTPAKVRFLSVEPLLGPVDLDKYILPDVSEVQDIYAGHVPRNTTIDWVIIGGESGPGARHCNVDWIRDLVRQCKAAGVPCFVKQLGADPTYGNDTPIPERLSDRKGGDMAEWPEDLRVREFPL